MGPVNVPGTGLPHKLSDQARRLVKEATKTPMTTLKLKASGAEMGENLHSSTVAQVSSQFKALWESGKENATVKESSLKFTQRHVGDSKFSWKKVLQSDETKIKLFGHQTRCYDGEHQIQHSTPSPL